MKNLKETIDDLTEEELSEAFRAINSLLSKCEKVQDKFKPGTAQHTLLKHRINALRISSSLISKALEELRNDSIFPRLTS